MAETNRNYGRENYHSENYSRGNYNRSSYGQGGRGMTYIAGNTVRRVETMPDDWEKEQQRQRKREEREQQERREQRRRRTIARRNQDKALIMNRGYVAFLTLAAIVTCITAGLYIKLQSDITIRMEHVASLESDVSSLKSDNDAAYKRIITSVRMEDVKKRAMDELGMSYPQADQIVYYEPDYTDFMAQYGEIPE